MNLGLTKSSVRRGAKELVTVTDLTLDSHLKQFCSCSFLFRFFCVFPAAAQVLFSG